MADGIHRPGSLPIRANIDVTDAIADMTAPHLHSSLLVIAFAAMLHDK